MAICTYLSRQGNTGLIYCLFSFFVIVLQNYVPEVSALDTTANPLEVDPDTKVRNSMAPFDASYTISLTYFAFFLRTQTGPPPLNRHGQPPSPSLRPSISFNLHPNPTQRPRCRSSAQGLKSIRARDWNGNTLLLVFSLIGSLAPSSSVTFRC